MDSQFELIRLNQFLQISVSGQIDIEQSISLLQQILDLDKSKPGLSIVLDSRRSKRLMEFKDFKNLAEIIARGGLDIQRQIACICPRDDIYFLKFLEVCMSERGYHKFKVFEDFETAFNWLYPPVDFTAHGEQILKSY